MLIDADSQQPAWTAEQVAEAAGLTLRSFHNYHQTGRGPKPDGWFGRTPYWLESTVTGWLEGRRK
jgi:hypothetical protein